MPRKAATCHAHWSTTQSQSEERVHDSGNKCFMAQDWEQFLQGCSLLGRQQMGQAGPAPAEGFYAPRNCSVSCHLTIRCTKPQYMQMLSDGQASRRRGAAELLQLSAQHASCMTRCGPLSHSPGYCTVHLVPTAACASNSQAAAAALPPAPTPAARRPRSSRTQICAMAGARSFLVRWHARAGLLCAPPQLPPGAVLLPACPELAPGVATP